MPSLNGRILCTEDDPDTRDMLTLLVKNCGYEIVSPIDARDALTLAINEDFDLLLVDNWMPGMSGVDLTREVRKLNKTTPILFYSGAATPTDIREALASGAQGYLIKPQGINDLMKEIARLIESSRLTS